MQKVLLVVDMQNVFARSEWHVVGIEKVIKNIKTLCERFDGKIIFTRHVSNKNAPGTWQDYNRAFASMEADPTNWDIVDELKPFAKNLITKHTYSCFHCDDFRKLIASCDDPELYIVGVETEFCVLGALFDAVDEGYRVSLVTDAVSGEIKKLNDAVIEICSRMPSQVKLITIEELLKKDIGRS